MDALDRTERVASTGEREMLVRVRVDLGTVTIASSSGACLEVDLEAVPGLTATLARLYDAQVSGGLPRTRAAALAASGVPEGATPVVTRKGLAGYVPKPRRGAPPPSGKPPKCGSCGGPLDADRRCGLCDLSDRGGRR